MPPDLPIPLWQVCMTALAAAWGACFGSFLNVCIYRIPHALSVVRPRSHCPVCWSGIEWYDNIPVLSYLALRGRCRHCLTHIAARYCLVEVLTAALFVLVWLKYGFHPGPRALALVPITNLTLVPLYWLAAAGLVLGAFVDLDHMIIPDRVTLGGIAIGVVASALVPSLHAQATWVGGLTAALVGIAVSGGLLWAVALLGEAILRKEAMGLGDVKLLGAIGAFCGWHAGLFTIIVASALGSVMGITLTLLRRRKAGAQMPFGPYLAVAAMAWILWGARLWGLYDVLLARLSAPSLAGL